MPWILPHLRLWLHRYREHRRQRRQLSQWKAEARRVRLQTLPLDLLLRSQLRSLEVSEAAEREKTASSPEARKPSPQTGRKTGCVKSEPARKNALQTRLLFHRQRLLVRLHPHLCQLKRRFLVWVICKALCLVRSRLSRGNPPL